MHGYLPPAIVWCLGVTRKGEDLIRPGGQQATRGVD